MPLRRGGCQGRASTQPSLAPRWQCRLARRGPDEGSSDCMYLRRLEIRDVRVLRGVALEPARGFNLLVGANGSGKTSVLEAVYLLGSGRSFRTRPAREVIARGRSDLCVFGQVRLEDERLETLGVEKGLQETRIRVSGETVRAASALARALPLVLLTPDSQRLLSDGAELRRRVVDWALFHVEPGYHELLQQYRRAVRQRNHALRGTGALSGVAPWTREVAELGTRLHERRAWYLQAVLQDVGRTVESVLGTQVEISYEPGWDTGRALAEVLAESSAEDRSRGYTGAGPHRADLVFSVDGRPAQHVLSRGEGKLFVASVMLGQVRYLAGRCGKLPIALVDDIASELDADGRGRFLQAVQATGAQAFLTALTEDSVVLPADTHNALFHVERGAVTKMV